MSKLKKIPIKKYKYTNKWDGEIKKIQIIKETDHSVFFKGDGRASKKTNDTTYEDTPGEAFAWILEKRKKEMEEKERVYEYYKKRHKELLNKGMILCKEN